MPISNQISIDYDFRNVYSLLQVVHLLLYDEYELFYWGTTR